MPTPTLSSIYSPLLLLALLLSPRLGDAYVGKKHSIAPDTVQVYLIIPLCPGELYRNVAWASDTTFQVFSPGQNGAEDTLTRIRIDVLPAPVFQISGDSTICRGDTAALKADGFFQGYLWSNGAKTQSIAVQTAGTYGVTVSNNNGCSGVRSVQVRASDPDAVAEAGDPLCAGGSDGFIRLSDFTGGIAPYEASLNGAPFTPDSTYTMLAGGLYRLILRDATGCADTFDLSLTEPPPFEVDIGPDRLLFPGDTLRLGAASTAPVQTYRWAPAGLFDCADCPSPFLAQPAGALVILEATGPDGCMARDTLLLQYQDSLFLYVPNAFAPESGGDNAVLSVFPGPGNWQVSGFRVFDRWGSLLYESLLPVRYPERLDWDGRAGGKTLAPGVYVWMANLQLADGKTIDRVGNIAVIR